MLGYEFIINKLWVLLVGWWWYDKRKMDARIKELEDRTDQQREEFLKIEGKLDRIEAVQKEKMDHISEILSDIKQSLRS